MIRCLSVVAAFSIFTMATNVQAASGCRDEICWKIENRFRLFTDKADFDRHVAVHNAGHDSVLSMERSLAEKFPNGWAGGVVNRLCFDDVRNIVKESCLRDGFKENYLNPKSFAIRLEARLPEGGALPRCEWTTGSGRTAQKHDGCRDVELRIPAGSTKIALSMFLPDGTVQTAETIATPTDIFIAGLGDSFTSGEGNPDVPVKLQSVGDSGICYLRLYNLGALGGLTGFSRHSTEMTNINDGDRPFFLPSRDTWHIDRSCPGAGENQTRFDAPEWVDGRAKWLHAPCHRSLYGHQLRAALALAIENEHRTVTYLPLGCTGAEIEDGLFNGQKSREILVRGNRTAPSITEGQISNLQKRVASSGRKLDLVFLAIGGNDAGFSGLVGNIIIRGSVERWLLGLAGTLTTPEQSSVLLRKVPSNFRKLRIALRPLIGGDFSRVVYLPYPNPTKHDDGIACGSTRRGFDGHPAFGVDGATVDATSKYADEVLIPKLIEIASCGRSGGCDNPAKDAMRIAERHMEQFKSHGFCALGANEPHFDTDCLKDGGTFKSSDGLRQPFAQCLASASDFKPYASRQRWVRTANDSYLTAMTFPDSLPWFLKAASLSNGFWGLTSVVYGGALHPTAEGHAAMADAVLERARQVLGNSKVAAAR